MFQNLYTGLLFGTLCKEAQGVYLPTFDGGANIRDEEDVALNIEQLDLSPWIDISHQQGDMLYTHKTITHFPPSSLVPLEHAFTLVMGNDVC